MFGQGYWRSPGRQATQYTIPFERMWKELTLMLVETDRPTATCNQDVTAAVVCEPVVCDPTAWNAWSSTNASCQDWVEGGGVEYLCAHAHRLRAAMKRVRTLIALGTTICDHQLIGQPRAYAIRHGKSQSGAIGCVVGLPDICQVPIRSARNVAPLNLCLTPIASFHFLLDT
jgi:hypothetical protein